MGEPQELTSDRGTRFRLTLSAEGDDPPLVQVEATFDGGGPPMEVAGLDAAEAVELAGFLLRLARVAQVERNEAR